MQLREWLRSAEEALSAAGIDLDDAQIEPRLIAEAVLDISSAQLLLKQRELLSTAELNTLRAMLDRRTQREPLSQVLGQWEFWSLPFVVTADTLTPRPDTEVLIEEVLEWLSTSPLARPGARLIDIGTGTGCIGLSIASERPQLRYELIDLCPKALEVARLNLTKLRALGEISDQTEVHLSCADLFTDQTSLEPPIAIVSNPPYIRRDVSDTLAPEVVQYEPHIALFGEGEDGLGEVRRIATNAAQQLSAGGGLFLEVGYDQTEQTAELMRRAGLIEVKIRHDYGGQPRVVSGRKEWRKNGSATSASNL